MSTQTSPSKALITGLLTIACAQAMPAVAGPFSAVLPSSRSVAIDAPATAFATVLNPDDVIAEGCTIAPTTGVDASFFFQTTDAATNALTGVLNEPVDIPAGGSQSFLIGLTPNSDFAATPVEFAFTCSTGTAPSAFGINTLLLSGNTELVADVIGVAVTPSLDGIVNLPRDGLFGVIALATTNVGAQATITAEPLDGVGLDGFLLICETNQDTGACLLDPAASTTGLLEADGTRTYSVFANSNTAVTLDPTNLRIPVQFSDEFGNIRGSTSVAVQGGGPSAFSFFDENIADQVLQNTCTECHIAGGTAETTELVFALDEVPNYETINFNVVKTYLEADAGNADMLTSLPTGADGHPMILTADSTEISLLLTFLELFATE